jgi:hypothetical protein
MEFSAVTDDSKPNFNRDDFNKLFENKIIRDIKQSTVDEATMLASMNNVDEPTPATKIHQLSIPQFFNNLVNTFYSLLMDLFTLNTNNIQQYTTGDKAVYTSIGLFLFIFVLFALL